MISRRYIDPIAKRNEVLSGAVVSEILGSNYCTVCGAMSSFDTYADRKKVLCKNCNSLERHRAMFALLHESFVVDNDSKVLYIGEDYITGAYLPQYYDTTIVKIDRNNDSTPIPLPEGKFDLIILGDLLEHVSDIPAFLEKIKGNLAEGGYIFAHGVPGKANSVVKDVSDDGLVWYKSPVKTYGEGSFAAEIGKALTYEVVTVKKCIPESQIKLFSIKNGFDYFICKVQ